MGPDLLYVSLILLGPVATKCTSNPGERQEHKENKPDLTSKFTAYITSAKVPLVMENHMTKPQYQWIMKYNLLLRQELQSHMTRKWILRRGRLGMTMHFNTSPNQIKC